MSRTGYTPNGVELKPANDGKILEELAYSDERMTGWQDYQLLYLSISALRHASKGMGSSLDEIYDLTMYAPILVLTEIDITPALDEMGAKYDYKLVENAFTRIVHAIDQTEEKFLDGELLWRDVVIRRDMIIEMIERSCDTLYARYEQVLRERDA